MRTLASCAAAFAAALLLTAVPAPAAAQFAADSTWAATWQASPEPARAPTVTLQQQTVRQVVRVSLGGGRFRVRLSNDFGDKPVNIGAAHIALAGVGSQTQAGSDRVLTFGGRRFTTIPPHASILSDAVDLPVPSLASLAVSLYFPDPTPVDTEHFFALSTAYVAPRDQTAAPAMPGASTITKRAFLSGVEVSMSKKPKVIVALGDSITGGFGSTIDANRRWPDYLAERLIAKKSLTAVVNAGIGGNRLLHDFIGPNALSRLDRDVLSQPKATHLIVLEGINDLGFPGGRNLAQEDVTAEDLIGAYKQIIARARAHGIKVIGATLTPFGPIPERPGYYSEAAAAKREAVNNWIRTSRAFDGVIDFDAALRDPAAPTRMRPAYDSGDHLSPNDAGYKAMADAIDLKLLD
jgi:lysophospholipase L1-like esterase